MKKIKAYIQGWYRYHLYYSKHWLKIDLSCLIRKHIREQIVVRINSMNKKCYNDGSCKECGCSTTALQMANKACDGDCYPKMLSLFGWSEIKRMSVHKGYYILIDKFSWRLENDKFVSYELENKSN